MKRITAFLLILCVNLLRLPLGPIGAARAQTQAQAQFRTQAQNSRIISLSPSITHTLQQMGLDERICGRTSYCPTPLDGHKSVIIGNVLEINLEQILRLKPDVVFAMSFTKPETLEKLRKAGIRVENFPTPESFEEICEQTLIMAQCLGCREKAQRWTDSMEARVRHISLKAREASAGKPRPKVFFQIGDHPVFPVIEGTYMNQYLSLLGLENIVRNYKGGGISREYVLAAEPDIILVSMMGGNGEAVMRRWMSFPSIPAVSAGRITLIDDTKACCPTPLFFAETLETIFKYVYGR